MDVKSKKGLIIKTWERCRSIGGRGGGGKMMRSSRSRPCTGGGGGGGEEDKRIRKRQVAPEGCFSVYVGPQKQRFVIKTEYVNHPLFKVLLDEAELEYGYNCEGPLVLPCNVDLFYKVLVEMDCSDEISQVRSFPKGYGSYCLLSRSPLVAMNNF